MCIARAVCCSMRILWRSGLPAKCHGPLPLDLLGKGPPSIAQVIVIVLGFVTIQNKVGSVSCLKERYIQYEESGLSCAQRGLCGKVYRPSSQDLSPARFLCVNQCSPLRL